jgi:hypothetical protein
VSRESRESKGRNNAVNCPSLVARLACLLAEPPSAVPQWLHLKGFSPVCGVLQEAEGPGERERQSRREVSQESRESEGGNAVTCCSLVRGAVRDIEWLIAGPLIAEAALEGHLAGVLQEAGGGALPPLSLFSLQAAGPSPLLCSGKTTENGHFACAAQKENWWLASSKKLLAL